MGMLCTHLQVHEYPGQSVRLKLGMVGVHEPHVSKERPESEENKDDGDEEELEVHHLEGRQETTGVESVSHLGGGELGDEQLNEIVAARMHVRARFGAKH